MTDIKAGICGASGKMGRSIIKVVHSDKDMKLSGALEASNNPFLGKDCGVIAGIGSLGTNITDKRDLFFNNLDVVIDFSSTNVISENLKAAVELNCSYVLGTTGLDNDLIDLINACSKNIPIIMSSNMSLGVNIALHITNKIAGLLDESYDVEIQEIHHNEKIDAPSGTALALGKEVAKGRNINFEKNSTYSRHGSTGKRLKGSIGFSAQRGGDVVGDHVVSFVGLSERLEIVHKASNRIIFANGAVKGAKWLVRQPPGLYDMKDMLGLNK